MIGVATLTRASRVAVMVDDAHQTFADVWRRAVDRHADRPFLLFRSEDGEIGT